MSTFRSLVLSIEAAAKAEGLTLPMSKLRDAIALALVDRPYAAAMAAEAAGTLGAVSLPPPHLAKACAVYRLDAATFARAFPTGDTTAPTNTAVAHTPDDGLTFRLENLRTGELAPLFCQYAGQHQPQPAYVELDEGGEVTADASGEIGNGMSAYVWHGRTRRYTVAPHADGADLADYLEGDGRALLARIHAGHEVEWNGNNHVGRLNDDAREAEEALTQALDDLTQDPDHQNQVWSVGDYLFNAGTLTDAWEHQTLAEAVEAIRQEAARERIRLTGDIEDALLTEAIEVFDRHPERISRHVARTLVARGHRTLSDYAEWIADGGDGTDVAESTKDAALEQPPLWIEDAGASTEEIERGVAAARDVLTARGVAITQAYLASVLRGNDEDQLIPAHLAAWDDAESAAITACFAGWARIPEAAHLALG